MESKVKIINPVSVSLKGYTKNVCAYCRVSTDMSEQIGSYETQKEYYEKYISQKAGWRFAGIYADYGKTGTKQDGRVEFYRMLEDCQLGKIDMIITKSVTRFARNTLDCIKTIRELKKINVDVFFEKENIHTISEKSELMLTILSSVAQAESESISTNEKWSVQKRFMDGSYKIGKPAYGYVLDENGELKQDKKAVKTVRFIFDEYLNGNGAWTIAKKLNSKRIITPTGKNKWDAHTVRDILKNITYSGDIIYQKYYTTDTLPFLQKRNFGEYPQVLVENNHKAVVSKEEYENVQRMFEIRDNNADRSKRYEFSSKIKCGRCGSVFRRHIDTKSGGYKKIQWCCKTHIESKEICDMKAVNEDTIKEKFMVMWNKLLANCDEILVPMLESLERVRLSSKKQKLYEEYENKIGKLSEQNRVFNQLMMNGYIDSVFYIEQTNKTITQSEELKKKKEMLLKSSKAQKEISETKNIIRMIHSSGKNYAEEYDREIFQQIVEGVIINPQNEMVFRLKNGLELAEKY